MVTIIAFIVGVFTVYFSEQRLWDYDDSVYELNLDSNQFNLLKPKKRWELPKKLKEISGLSYFGGNKLACIQDEDAVFYVYDLNNEAIIRDDTFGKKGDYEDVEVIDDIAYVLNSNGDIYYFHIENQGIGEVKKIKTDLSKHNDAEGLGFDRFTNELLIACKEDPGIKDVKIEKSRSIYSLNLNNRKLIHNPKYIVDSESYDEMLEKKGLNRKKHKPFKPSGIAIHPKTNYVFIIATVGKMMVILSPDGKIADLIPLDPGLFVQPEGICFSPEGDLYISSEGRGKKGYILKF